MVTPDALSTYYRATCKTIQLLQAASVWVKIGPAALAARCTHQVVVGMNNSAASWFIAYCLSNPSCTCSLTMRKQVDYCRMSVVNHYTITPCIFGRIKCRIGSG